MNFSLWAILVAAMLPYVTVAFAKFGGVGYDNAAPRLWSERLQGWRRRAEWAHRNHFEAFPAFAAAVLVAHVADAPSAWSDGLAGGFIVFRVGYALAYVADRQALRSALWFLALSCVAGLFGAASFGGGAG